MALRNIKKYDKGEFRDTVRDLFLYKKTKNRSYFTIELDNCIDIMFNSYTYENEKVFSYTLMINYKTTKKVKIPIEYLDGQIRSVFNKVINYIDTIVVLK